MTLADPIIHVIDRGALAKTIKKTVTAARIIAAMRNNDLHIFFISERECITSIDMDAKKRETIKCIVIDATKNKYPKDNSYVDHIVEMEIDAIAIPTPDKDYEFNRYKTYHSFMSKYLAQKIGVQRSLFTYEKITFMGKGYLAIHLCSGSWDIKSFMKLVTETGGVNIAATYIVKIRSICGPMILVPDTAVSRVAFVVDYIASFETITLPQLSHKEIRIRKKLEKIIQKRRVNIINSHPYDIDGKRLNLDDLYTEVIREERRFNGVKMSKKALTNELEARGIEVSGNEEFDSILEKYVVIDDTYNADVRREIAKEYLRTLANHIPMEDIILRLSPSINDRYVRDNHVWHMSFPIHAIKMGFVEILTIEEGVKEVFNTREEMKDKETSIEETKYQWRESENILDYN